MPSGPGKDAMPGFAYWLFLEDGSDVGEASYAVPIKPDDVVHLAGGARMRVLDLVPMPEEDSLLTGLLKVEPE